MIEMVDPMFTMNLNGILAKILEIVYKFVEKIIQKEIGIMPLD